MLCQSLRSINQVSKRSLHTAKCLNYFFEPDRNRGLKTVYDNPPEIPKGFIKQSAYTLKTLKVELGKWKHELIDKFSFINRVLYRHGEVDVVHRFSTDPKCLDNWTCTCDSDYEVGNSTAKLELSECGTGIFSGYIDTNCPKDGQLEDTGFANITTTPKFKSFFRQISYDWSPYSHLVFRVRGDGRTYMINLIGKQEVDMAFFDLYNYFLYTRGGPYWQYTRIPFSKFFFSSKGHVQNTQGPLMKCDTMKIGITLADKITGPFRLEIDYIGVEVDDSHKEQFAYEDYKFAKPMI